MPRIIVCDYCGTEVTENRTLMNVQTVDRSGGTSVTDGSQFDFHPTCYNTLQGLIFQLAQAGGKKTIEPVAATPPEQPANPNDPSPPAVPDLPDTASDAANPGRPSKTPSV
jgi:hypothetical protein